ncbi:MAG: hypothetical protein SXQ77_07460 [Halobacteria archaeon]|nr:hypothetical protein [Halobacteria archaeon]
MSVVGLLILLAGCMGGHSSTDEVNNSVNNSNVKPPNRNTSYNMTLVGSNPSSADKIISKERILSSMKLNKSDPDVSVNLYYVDSQANWWHASPNGTILRPAPNGSDSPLVGHEIPSENRTSEYVWKVRISADLRSPGRHGGYMGAVNATSGKIFSEVESP